MTFMNQILFFLIVWLCVYIIVHRICRCIEQRAIARSFIAYSISQIDKSMPFDQSAMKDLCKDIMGGKQKWEEQSDGE